MNFSKQLKKYREQSNLSQEKLAKKIYVSRQTVSKWENDKSYPDIHNLIALSVLFGISLDELIKGDVPEMKKQITCKQTKRDSWSMLVFLILMFIVGIPSVYIWGIKGFALGIISWMISMYFALKLEKVKKQNNLKTYKEIVAFIENKEVLLKELQKNRNEKRSLAEKWVILIGFTVIFTILALATVFVTSHVLN